MVRLTGAACALALLGTAVRPSAAYRMFPPDESQVLPGGAADALRWDPRVWEPGGILTFVVEGGPGWSVRFERPEEALPFVESALASWSALPTADISWRVRGVEAGAGFARDGRNTVSVSDDPESVVSRTAVWQVVGSEPRMFEECDVILSQRFAVEDLDGVGLSVLIRLSAHEGVLAEAPFVIAHDRFLPRPIEVRAGAESGGIALSVRPRPGF